MSRQSRVVFASVVAAAVLACNGPTPDITPLARAAREGNAATIAAMVAAGQDPNGVDPGGNRGRRCCTRFTRDAVRQSTPC